MEIVQTRCAVTVYTGEEFSSTFFNPSSGEYEGKVLHLFEDAHGEIQLHIIALEDYLIPYTKTKLSQEQIDKIKNLLNI